MTCTVINEQMIEHWLHRVVIICPQHQVKGVIYILLIKHHYLQFNLAFGAYKLIYFSVSLTYYSLQSITFLSLFSLLLQLQYICCWRWPQQYFQLFLQSIRCELWKQTSSVGGAIRQTAPLQWDNFKLFHAESTGQFRWPALFCCSGRLQEPSLLHPHPSSRSPWQRAAEFIRQWDWDSNRQPLFLLRELFLMYGESGHGQRGSRGGIWLGGQPSSCSFFSFLTSFCTTANSSFFSFSTHAYPRGEHSLLFLLLQICISYISKA